MVKRRHGARVIFHSDAAVADERFTCHEKPGVAKSSQTEADMAESLKVTIYGKDT
jgi:hypothetical protein